MYVEREITKQFGKAAGVYNIVAVVGARQAGKTTFLKQQATTLNASYVLFDDPDARALFEEDVKKFEKQYVEGREVAILDEVQQCPGAGTKLKYLADTGRKLWITSSSEIILSKEILSRLVGRVSILRLYPFSLKEFMTANNQKQLNKTIMERSVWEHVTYGGYPKVVTTTDVELKKTILRDLYETMLLKDVVVAFGIEEVRSLEEFSKYLAVNTGSALSYENVSRNIGLSFQTIKKYLDAMEKSHLIARIPPFHSNKSKEITKQPKTYFIDTGLRNAIARNFPTEPDGRLFENYVLSELLKQGFFPKYWRTKSGAEVDFVIENEGQVIPVEAKLKASERIERGLRSFLETYKPRKAVVVSCKGNESEAKIGSCKIFFTNALGLGEILGTEKLEHAVKEDVDWGLHGK